MPSVTALEAKVTIRVRFFFLHLPSYDVQEMCMNSHTAMRVGIVLSCLTATYAQEMYSTWKCVLESQGYRSTIYR